MVRPPSKPIAAIIAQVGGGLKAGRGIFPTEIQAREARCQARYVSLTRMPSAPEDLPAERRHHEQAEGPAGDGSPQHEGGR
jgi:hypothetical protein